MLEELVEQLRANRQIDGFKVVEECTEAQEYFLIKHELDMNRAKSVRKIYVTVYKDCEISGVKYKGSARVMVHPSMGKAEVEKLIEETVFSASLVKNPYYGLPKPSTVNMPLQPQHHATADQAFAKATELIAALRQADQELSGWVNSAELFISRIHRRVINSEGIDRCGEQIRHDLELIVTWPGEREEVELYQELQLAELTPEVVFAKTQELLLLCQRKANAVATPALRKHTVLLTGEPVRELLRYYYAQTSAKIVYEGVSTFKPGDAAQGQDVRGDRIHLVLEPALNNAVNTFGFDNDGVALQPVEIIKEGEVHQLWGDQQHCSYLDIPVTGAIPNTVFDSGSRTVAEMKSQPFLELLAFSDFQTNAITGDFSGEIRLGRYFDGHNVTAVTGGSISGNLRTVQKEMYFSKERQDTADFSGPLTVQLFDVAVTGQG